MRRSAPPWLPYWPVPPLPADEVHVIRLAVRDACPSLSQLQTLLTQDERERAAAFRFEMDRARSVVARGGLRLVLGQLLGVPAAEVRFRHNGYGKPLLRDAAEDIRFNVSHSGELVVFAVGRGRRVGIDVELVRDDVPHLQMSQRFFSVEEHRRLRTHPPGQQRRLFFETWTRKEAYVKGRGRGLSIPTDAFSVAMDGEASTPVDDQQCISRPGRWRTVRLEVGAGHAAAVAGEGSEWRLRCFEGSPLLNALLRSAPSGGHDGSGPSSQPAAGHEALHHRR